MLLTLVTFLRSAIGLPVAVESAVVPLAFDAAAYDLTVEGLHTFYVLAGEVSVLVHNADACATTLYHGSDIPSLVNILNNGLDAGRAAANYTDGPGGFFLATHADDAVYFCYSQW